jgi:hypothetical protein
VLRNVGERTAGSGPGGSVWLRLVLPRHRASSWRHGVFSTPSSLSRGRQRLLSLFGKLGIDALIGDETRPSGAVETEEDARRYAALFQANRARIDGILVSLPNGTRGCFCILTGVEQSQAVAEPRLQTPPLAS